MMTAPPPAADTRAADARVLLGDAEAHLDRARAHLAASPPDYAATLDATLASFRSALLAHLTGYGAEPDADAPLGDLAARAIRSDSVLKTAADRAMTLAGRSPALRPDARPSVNEREDVETGWYTARNLIRTVARSLATRT